MTKKVSPQDFLHLKKLILITLKDQEWGSSFRIQTMSCNRKVNLQLFMILYRNNFVSAAADLKEIQEILKGSKTAPMLS